MNEITVKNQKEFDAIPKDFDGMIIIEGSETIIIWESSAPRIVAWGNSAPRIVARGNSAPRIVARESSAPRIEAWESSAPRIEAWESSAVKGSASPYAIISGHVSSGAKINLTGDHCIVLMQPVIESIRDWCAYYGVPIKDNVAIVYKGVRDDYKSAHNFAYLPGTSPVAPDWDGGKEECGGGLHFSPSPIAALEFDCEVTRFLACPVAIADMRDPRKDDEYPKKIKAAKICGAIYEVDRDGEAIKT